MRPFSNLFVSLVAPIVLCGALFAQMPNAPVAIPSEIVVDQSCRLVTEDLRDPSKPRERHRYDRGVCYLDGGTNISTRWEKNIVNGKPRGTTVQIVEREYVMHNPYSQPVTFVVKQKVGKFHRIDSDPQPTEIVDSVAIFKVVAGPGQTVRLHVGDRDPG